MSDAAAGKNTSVPADGFRDRLLLELDAEARRLWGAAIDRLSPEEYRECLLCLALDRIARGECAGLLRRKPATVANLREEKLRRGIH